jgi:hypothetical protein
MGLVCKKVTVMGTKKEYYYVNEICKLKKMTARNVRAIITKLDVDKSDYMLRKAKDGVWEVHHLMLPLFERQRQKENNYYALTIDPVYDMSEKDINSIMDFVFTTTGEPNLEINYVVHSKIANGRNHIHAYVKTKQKRKLESAIKLCFSNSSYKLTDVFDLNGWVEYITRTGAQIITLSKE